MTLFMCLIAKRIHAHCREFETQSWDTSNGRQVWHLCIPGPPTRMCGTTGGRSRGGPHMPGVPLIFSEVGPQLCSSPLFCLLVSSHFCQPSCLSLPTHHLQQVTEHLPQPCVSSFPGSPQTFYWNLGAQSCPCFQAGPADLGNSASASWGLTDGWAPMSSEEVGASPGKPERNPPFSLSALPLSPQPRAAYIWSWGTQSRTWDRAWPGFE